jgi:group I intron endonuclease
MAYGFIYITTNLVNGKQYIGQCRYGKRGWENYLGSGKHITLAIKKYGVENFKREILAEAETKPELSDLERYYIKQYGAVENSNFYNIADGGYATRGFLGRTHSEETRKKMSESAMGHAVSDKTKEAVAKTSKARTGTTYEKSLYDNRRGHNHARAISIELDGVTYPTISAACEATGYTQGAIRRFIKLGIHPSVVLERKYSNGGSSPRAKPVIINGKFYPSHRQAKLELGKDYLKESLPPRESR